MWENYLLHLFEGHLHLDGHAGSVNHLAGGVSKHMNAKYFAVLLPYQDFA